MVVTFSYACYLSKIGRASFREGKFLKSDSTTIEYGYMEWRDREGFLFYIIPIDFRDMDERILDKNRPNRVLSPYRLRKLLKENLENPKKTAYLTLV